MRGRVFKRGKTWTYMVDVGTDPKTGKRKQKKKRGFETKKEAEKSMAEVIVQAENGSYMDETNMTFEVFAENWFDMYKNSGRVKESTADLRKLEIAKLMNYFRHLKLKNITGLLYQNMLNDLHEKGSARNTIARINSTGKMIFTKAAYLKIIKENPTAGAVVPRSTVTVEDIENGADIPKYFEKEELKTFLSTAKNYGMEQDFEIFSLLAYSGMRAGELCALRWTDINFNENTIRITKTCYTKNHNTLKYILQTPKTKSSIRIIEMDEASLNVLKKLKTLQATQKLKHGQLYRDENFLFVNTNKYPGYPLSTCRIETRMSRLLRLSPSLNQDLTPHSLRHTHTSLLAEAGVGLEEIMHRLGHRDDTITRTIYLHVTKSMRREASRKFSDLMENT